MERLMDRRKMMRLMVCALIYLALLVGTVVLFLGSVWFLKNVGYGWLMISLLCLVIGGRLV